MYRTLLASVALLMVMAAAALAFDHCPPETESGDVLFQVRHCVTGQVMSNATLHMTVRFPDENGNIDMTGWCDTFDVTADENGNYIAHFEEIAKGSSIQVAIDPPIGPTNSCHFFIVFDAVPSGWADLDPDTRVHWVGCEQGECPDDELPHGYRLRYNPNGG